MLSSAALLYRLPGYAGYDKVPGTSSASPPPECSRRKEPHLIRHLQHFRTSGAIAESSPSLINLLLRSIDFERAGTVVQLGVGTGVITRELLRRMRPDSRLISVEVNPVFVDAGRRIRDPRLTVRHDCAGSLLQILEELGISEIDYVVSSLPLAMMNNDLVDRILEATHGSLAADGMFLQYQYSLKHRSALERRYRDVRLSFTLRNLPPAFVYACSRRAG